MMLSTIPATVEALQNFVIVEAEISIIRTKKVPDLNCTCFPYTVFSLILELERIKSYLNGEATMTTQVAGYTYGTNDVARSPLTLEDLNLLNRPFYLPKMTKYLEKLEKCWQTKLMRFWIRGIPLLVLTLIWRNTSALQTINY